jgi:endonuclease III related protein
MVVSDTGRDARKECVKRRRGEGPFLVIDMYVRLYDSFGPQGWWPGDGAFETVCGAILTQNTAWTHVEKAIDALKSADLLEPKKMAGVDEEALASLIRPAGYFHQKAKRLKDFSIWLIESWDGDLAKMFESPVLTLRCQLLERPGIGPETADSMILYAGGRPVFVIDAYTKRIIKRVGLTKLEDYHELQKFFERNLPVDVELYKEYHALLVELGKRHCAADPTKANCGGCPIGADCENRLFAEV